MLELLFTFMVFTQDPLTTEVVVVGISDLTYQTCAEYTDKLKQEYTLDTAYSICVPQIEKFY